MKPNHVTLSILANLIAIGAAGPTHAEEGPAVTLPLALYESMSAHESPPPTQAWAMGAKVSIREHKDHGLRIQAEVSLKNSASDPQLVRVLPGDAQAVALMASPEPLKLERHPEGYYVTLPPQGQPISLTLEYETRHQQDGTRTWAMVPLPPTEVDLKVVINDANADIAMHPVRDRQDARDDQLEITATVARSEYLYIAGDNHRTRPFAFMASRFTGRFEGEALVLSGSIGVEQFTAKAEVPLGLGGLPLAQLTTRGQRVPSFVGDDGVVAILHKRGKKELKLQFSIPTKELDGVPTLSAHLPKAPICELDLLLPRGSEIELESPGHIQKRGQRRMVTLGSPGDFRAVLRRQVQSKSKEKPKFEAVMHHQVKWSENAFVVVTKMDVLPRRGEVSEVRLALPRNTDVLDVTADAADVLDWRPLKDELVVQLDRAVDTRFSVMVEYNHLAPGDDARTLPLLGAKRASRERGFVVLASSDEASLSPTGGTGSVEIGENRLPEDFRKSITDPITHVLKYVDGRPSVTVKKVPPKKRPLRFETRIETLLSLKETVATASSEVWVDVRSGKLNQVQIAMPHGATVLEVTAPSKRNWEVDEDGLLALSFARQMEGGFGIKLVYEHRLEGAEGSFGFVDVSQDDAQSGQIAIEVLNAAELSTSEMEGVVRLPPSELSKELRYRAERPIRLAFRYDGGNAQPKLRLKTVRYEEQSLVRAMIERADAKSLLTPDGVWVHDIEYQVKGSEEAFLRVCLPEQGEVWKAKVGQELVSPAAMAGGQSDCKNEVLIPLKNSHAPYPVRLMVKEPGSKFAWFGSLTKRLPRTSLIVTDASWTFFFPEELGVSIADGNMLRQPFGDATAVEPDPDFQIPFRGASVSFSKIYPGESKDGAFVVFTFHKGWVGPWLALGLLLLLGGLGVVAWRRYGGRLALLSS